MSYEPVSRRAFLKGSAVSGSTIILGSITATKTANAALDAAAREDVVRVLSPRKATVVPGFLAAKLRWEYAAGEAPHGVTLTVTPQHDQQHPIVNVVLRGDVTTYALPLIPSQAYAWQLQPTDTRGQPTVAPVQGTFTTGAIRLVEDASPEEKYKNPRKGARYSPFKPMPFAAEEPLSPWYEVKHYTMAPPPKLDGIKDQLPHPVLDGHPDALEAYWYCWRIFVDEWNYAPAHPDNQAVANINGCPTWAGWGSSQVWDSFCMMKYAKYGHQAHQFITQYDNAYARQHENGFICQESDNDNREVYACDPALCPYLIGWTEWNYYQVSGDVQRLRRVFTPLVKNYEWFMTYMRHAPDGIYGFVTPATRDTCGTDPFNFAFEATALRTAETLAMARIATIVDRPDMARFFMAEYRRLGDYVNQHYWDSEHELYNDRCDPNHLVKEYRNPQLASKFITEVKPGVFNKCCWTFLPLFAEIAPHERVRVLARLLQDPHKGFDWPNGLGYYSLDSAPQTWNGDDIDASAGGQTKIWPPVQYVAQDGFKQAGEWAVAQALAERYFGAVVGAYLNGKMIREALDPRKPKFVGYADFVGWGGLAPIANFIEYILGFDITVPENAITWRISRTERHGIQNLKFGTFYVQLICEARQTADEPCRLTISSGGAFDLRVVVHGKSIEKRIEEGAVTVEAS
jgi:hypothetical protein